VCCFQTLEKVLCFGVCGLCMFYFVYCTFVCVINYQDVIYVSGVEGYQFGV